MQDAALVLEGSQIDESLLLANVYIEPLLTGSALDLVLELEYEEIMFKTKVERIARDRQAMPKYLVNIVKLKPADNDPSVSLRLTAPLTQGESNSFPLTGKVADEVCRMRWQKLKAFA